MKRLLILLLLTIVAAGFLGTLIARDPGYVLIAYDGYSMQTSLWVLLGLVVTVVVVALLLWRLYRVIVRSPVAIRLWRDARRAARVDRLHDKGVALLSEGEATRARKFLDTAVRSSDSSGIYYLEAARAADAAGDAEAREAYLRQAEEADPSLARARCVVAAEMALERGDPDAALAALKDVKTNARIARLRIRAMGMKDDWREQLSHLADLRQLDPDQAQITEKSAAIQGLSEESGNDAAVTALYQSLSAGCRQDPDVMSAWTRALQDKSPAEPVLRAAVKKAFNSQLVELYGDLGETGEGTLKTRLKTAQGWLKKHPGEPSVHFCLGCLHEISGEAGLARDAFARSVELGGQVNARQRYGLLLARDGQYEKSTEQFRLALQTETTHYPVVLGRGA